MSQVYSTEPQTSGTVVLETTHGPLSIHLWCKECPHTVRFFLQLCLDGFYDNLVFHRIVPSFLIQTGDPCFRQNGNNEDETKHDGINPWQQPLPKKYRHQHRATEALDRRQYEINSRIRFNHRGQIAMALGVDDSDDEGNMEKSFARLQPQFFITLEEASYLDGKHVCFGGINGPTIFNALRIGQTDVINSNDENETRNFQPRIMSEAPRILRAKIQGSPDLPLTLPALAPTTDRSLLPWKIDHSASAGKKPDVSSKRKKKNRKGVKNMNLLSFGEEMIDEGANKSGEPNKTVKKIQSTHDALRDRTLSKESIKIERVEEIGDNHKGEQNTFNLKNKVTETKNNSLEQSKEDDFQNNGSFESSSSHVYSSSSFKNKTTEHAIEKISATTKTDTPLQFNSSNNDVGDAEKKKKQKKKSLVEARRAKYASKNKNRMGGSKQQRENETMKKFKEFQQKMASTTTDRSTRDEDDNYHGQILERNADSSNWISTKFKCKRHIDQNAKTRGSDGRDIEDYKVIEERNSATDRKAGKRKRFRAAI